MSFTSITIAGTTIGTWARNARLLKALSGSRRGQNFTIPYRDGEWSDPMKWHTAADLLLEVAFKRSPSPEANMSGLSEALTDPLNLVTIAGQTPFHGNIQTQVELLAEPSPHVQDPTVYIFQLRNPSGVWEDTTATTSTGDPPSVTTTGDRPIDDMVLTFATTGNVSHTHSRGKIVFTLSTSASTGTVIDMGDRTVQTSTGGAQDNVLAITSTGRYPGWMRWEPNSTQNIGSTGLAKVVWRNKYAL